MLIAGGFDSTKSYQKLAFSKSPFDGYDFPVRHLGKIVNVYPVSAEISVASPVWLFKFALI